MLDFNIEDISPEQKADNDVAVMHHSVAVIRDNITRCTHSAEEHDNVKRNLSHLEIMLAKEHIINHSSDKSEFYSAIVLGKEHLA